MITLSNQNLANLKSKFNKIPLYNRMELSPSLVHIGLGAFHRAHYLSYIEELMDKGIYTQGVHEIDIIDSNNEFVTELRNQDYLYSILEKDPFGNERLEIRGGIADYTNYCNDSEKVLSILASDKTKLISLTVTEKGYCYDSENHKLDLTNQLIINDLEEDFPSTLIGVLSKSLNNRFNSAKAPVTIMSCDNVPENGNMLKGCIYEFISIKYPQILSWVKENINFPNTMVDRITPATSQKDIEELESKYNLHDICGVHCEDFKTWVIEDIDIPEIQMFSKVGALIVDSVLPYELMKIRLLNGAHSALSYPSYLLGHRDVDEGINDPLIKDFIRNHYMEEITKSLNPVPGVDLEIYKDQLIDRFSNKYIKDKLLRLASDGSKKITNAIVKPLLELKEKDALILSLAFWAEFLKGVDKEGHTIPIEDPNADLLQEKIKDDTSFMNYLGIKEENTIQKFSDFKSQINSKGIKETLKDFL